MVMSKENNNSNLALLKSAVFSALLAVVLVTVLTVAGELYAPLKNHLKDTLYHHWVGKGVWASVLFLVGTFALQSHFKKTEDDGKNLLWMLNLSLIAGSVIIFVFYVYEYVIHH